MSWGIILSSLAAVGLPTAVAVAFSKKWFTVEEGSVGVRTNWDKAERDKEGKVIVLPPGAYKVWPIWQSLKKAHTRLDYVEVSGFTVILNKGQGPHYYYSAYMTYRVSEKPDDVEKYIFKVQQKELKQLLQLKLMAIVRELLEKTKDFKSAGQSARLNLKKKLSDYMLKEFGIIVESCELSSFFATETFQWLQLVKLKLEVIKSIYGSLVKAPESVITASFGAVPTVNPQSELTTSSSSEEDEELRKITENEGAQIRSLMPGTATG